MFAALLLTLQLGQPNAKPGVVPTLREWTGGQGEIAFSQSTRICLEGELPANASKVAKTLQDDLRELAHLTPKIVKESGKANDIVLRFSKLPPKMSAEGYRLDFDGTAAITAETSTGLFYGTRSLLQMLVLSKRNAIPRGTANDWPDHAERGFLLDLGRKFFPTSFLRNYIRFMGWYKMNDFQLHLNDNGFRYGQQWSEVYAAFRLKSQRFPGLTAKDGSFSRKEIDALQDLADSYGVTLTPEIDAPAHALSLTHFRPELGSKKYGQDHLDLSNPESIEFVKQIWDEFIPWFRAKTVHIGADEYSSAAEAHAGYKKYINDVSAFVKSKGKKVRMWGGLKVGGGAEGVDRDIVVNLWYPGYHDPADAIREGYKLINTQDAFLYIVPFAGYYYQFLNSQWLYEHWVPNEFGETKFPYGDSSILGGMFAVWNDKGYFPYTSEDVHELVLPAMPTVAEKLWSGPSNGKRSFNDFQQDYRRLGAGPQVKICPPQIEKKSGNLAFRKSISATVRKEGYFGPNTLVDGRAATRWFADTKDKPIVTLDLGEIQQISRLILKWVPHETPESYVLSGSTDGKEWKVLGSEAISKESVKFPATPVRYIRIEIPEQKTKTVSLFEIEVYR